MAIRHNWTILCENMILSVEKKLSLIDITTNISVTSLPGTIPKLCIVTSMSGEAGDEYRMELVKPNGEGTFLLSEDRFAEDEVMGGSFQVSNSITYGEFRPFTVDSKGFYRIVLSQGDRVVHEHVFGVYLVSDDETNELESKFEGNPQ